MQQMVKEEGSGRLHINKNQQDLWLTKQRLMTGTRFHNTDNWKK